MRYRISSSLLFAFAFVAQAVGQQVAAPGIPAPAGASPQLRADIEGWVWPDIANLPPSPATEAQWRERIAGNDAQQASAIAPMLERSGVEVRQETIGGVNAYYLTPAILEPENVDRLILFLHGGAYVYFAGEAGLVEAILIAERVGIPVISVDYRMPPDHPFPAAVDDVVAVYSQLLDSRAPNTIAIGGTSAGGGLALAAVHQLRNLEMPFPGAIYAGTPWADLTKTGDTLYSHEGLDRVLLKYEGALSGAARLYAGDYDLNHPLLSPVYGDFSDFPPTILISGTRDLFLSDVARTHRKLRASGVVADLHVYEGMSHVGYLVSADSPESRSVYAELKLFVDRHLE